MWNSISQLLLKAASPGVPDFYQGSELWNFHLVDPDNRQPVDFELRKRIAARLRDQAEADPAALVCRLASNPCDGAIKLYITSRALKFRKDHWELFDEGSYVPLAARGARANHVVAFARTSGGKTVLALAGRFFLRLCNSHGVPWGEQVWGNTALVLPRKIPAVGFQDVLTGRPVEAEQHSDHSTVPLAAVFSHCPVALLFSGSSA
jgi:(1->4)-alpha-D-glucan 1-alpha-D-glucosylmutase